MYTDLSLAEDALVFWSIKVDLEVWVVVMVVVRGCWVETEKRAWKGNHK